MKTFISFLLFPAVFAIAGCVPVPVAVNTRVEPTYQEPPYQQPYQPPVIEQEMVEVPVVYGEPVYYPPPIVVRYTYDYYTYENFGGYVNIVFWRNGHRFHNEPWYVHGRRMRIEQMHEWQRNHRIPVRQFEHHRERLEHVHHISHPDTYYGRRPGGPVHPGRGHDIERTNPQWQDKSGRVTYQPHQPGQHQLTPDKKHELERVDEPRRDSYGRVISQPRQNWQQKPLEQKRVIPPKRDNDGRGLYQPRPQQKPQTLQTSGPQPNIKKQQPNLQKQQPNFQKQQPEREQKKNTGDKQIY